MLVLSRTIVVEVPKVKVRGEQVTGIDAGAGGIDLNGKTSKVAGATTKAPHTEVFEAIDWSTSGVFQQTLDRCAAAGLKTLVLPGWYDVDDAATLDRLRKELLDDPAAAPNTAAYLVSQLR